MRLTDAYTLGRRLLDDHGLLDWSLGLDNAKTRAGRSIPHQRRITLSRHLTSLHDEDEVRETLLHEIAHALVGAGHGHDDVWRAMAQKIGATGERCVSREAPKVEGVWTGSCPAGHEQSRHRTPTRVTSCGRCSRAFDPGHLVDWRWNGNEVLSHPLYLGEVARLVRRYGRQRVSLSAETVDTALSAAVQHPEMLSSDLGRLANGTPVRIVGDPTDSGTTGVIEKRGRTRYRVRTGQIVLSVPFASVMLVDVSQERRD